GIDGRGPGRSVATAEVVHAENGKAFCVQGAAGTDKTVPPPDLALVGPLHSDSWHGLVPTGGVLATREGVEDEDGIVGVGVEFAVLLVGERDFGEHGTALEGEGPLQRVESRLVRPGRGGVGHGGTNTLPNGSLPPRRHK